MRTATVTPELYPGAGWAVAVVDEATGTVIALRQIADPNTDLTAVTDELEDATPGLTNDMVVRGGMLSSGQFCYNFTDRERAQAGVSNCWI